MACPKLSSVVTQLRAVIGQAVETANGHQSAISSIATFSLQLGDYKDDMEAYVFDTKFDLILGNSWLRQVQPIPDLFHSSWSLKLSNGAFSIIKPIQQAKKFENVLNAQEKVLEIDTGDTDAADIDSARKTDIVCDGVTHVGAKGDIVGSGDTEGVDDKIILGSVGIDDVEDCDFVITARQFERLLKKKQVEECFLVSPKELHGLLDLNNVDLVVSDQEKENDAWCAEFAEVYPDVFKGAVMK
ncbi:hypothetical protein MAM1_0329c09737 [Mucor ambiguus]|uniref:Uncharacterized protein n=1 Tax=Mucor ambiguus TaxID=91626 RepID=A0A0C9MRX1_9FUNG|nr:hypothetical protein MAM1_0329c09737 [Mucor ambiguus]